ncbi:MAG: hypothetical protein R3D43_02230 [Tepidamorphaceae bacterium]|nr:DUF1344 domain-containing protein [Rhodobiaceae bacterium]MCC0049587.1 DUF1344 domain-containing protein [Rhodobiaceae bacterium]
MTQPKIKQLITVSALALSLATVSALASETETGKVVAYDMEARLLTLENGHEFFLAEDISTATMDIGDEVTLTYDEEEDGNLLATKMKVAE